MPSRPTLLLMLSLPLGAVVYTVAAQAMEEVFPKEPILSLLVPLFVAGLAMMPLLIPFFDRKAKADLAEYRRQQATADGVAPSAHPRMPRTAEDAEDPDTAAYDERDDPGGTEPMTMVATTTDLRDSIAPFLRFFDGPIWAGSLAPGCRRTSPSATRRRCRSPATSRRFGSSSSRRRRTGSPTS